MRQVQKKKNKGSIQLEQIDVREVLDDLSINYTSSGKNVSDDWIGVACPFCDDTSNHLGLCLTSPVISCFKCGTTGNYLKYFSEILGSFGKAIDILGEAVPRELRLYKREEKEIIHKVNLPTEATRKITKPFFNYLNKRKFNPIELTEKYNLHFCSEGYWENRIIIPIMRGYKLITFSSCSIEKDPSVRYRHYREDLSVIPIKNYLYGLDFTDGHTVIVVEGLFDKYRFGDNAVATFGTKVTEEQKRLLTKFSVVKIVADGDKSGRTMAEKLGNDLAPFCDVKIFNLPDNKDPDKLSAKEIKYIIEA